MRRPTISLTSCGRWLRPRRASAARAPTRPDAVASGSVFGVAPVQAALGHVCGSTGARSGLLGADPAAPADEGRRAASSVLIRWSRRALAPGSCPAQGESRGGQQRSGPTFFFYLRNWTCGLGEAMPLIAALSPKQVGMRSRSPGIMGTGPDSLKCTSIAAPVRLELSVIGAMGWKNPSRAMPWNPNAVSIQR